MAETKPAPYVSPEQLGLPGTRRITDSQAAAANAHLIERSKGGCYAGSLWEKHDEPEPRKGKR